jgi:hypothetical protein
VESLPLLASDSEVGYDFTPFPCFETGWHSNNATLPECFEDSPIVGGAVFPLTLGEKCFANIGHFEGGRDVFCSTHDISFVFGLCPLRYVLKVAYVCD